MEQVIGAYNAVIYGVFNNESRSCRYHFFFLIFFFTQISAHINHIKNVAGEDHVGLGAGYDGINQ